jgi:hypothetical protein
MNWKKKKKKKQKNNAQIGYMLQTRCVESYVAVFAKSLEKVELVGECKVVFLVKGLTDEKGELVGVLAQRGHAYRTRPVVVHVRQLIAEPLKMVRLKAT